MTDVTSAPRNRMAAFPPPPMTRASAASVAHWLDKLREHVAAAEKTRTERDAVYHQLERRNANDPGGLATAVRDDPDLPTLAWLLADHQAAAATYYQAIAGEAVSRQLLDRPVLPAGRRPAPGSAAAVDRAAAGESADGAGNTVGAGVNSGPRPTVVPAAPGARPGTGPDLEPGMTVSYKLRHGPGAPGTVVGTVLAVRADGVAHVRFKQGGTPMEVVAPAAAFSPVRTASAGEVSVVREGVWS